MLSAIGTDWAVIVDRSPSFEDERYGPGDTVEDHASSDLTKAISATFGSIVGGVPSECGTLVVAASKPSRECGSAAEKMGSHLPSASPLTGTIKGKRSIPSIEPSEPKCSHDVNASSVIRSFRAV